MLISQFHMHSAILVALTSLLERPKHLSLFLTTHIFQWETGDRSGIFQPAKSQIICIHSHSVFAFPNMETEKTTIAFLCHCFPNVSREIDCTPIAIKWLFYYILQLVWMQLRVVTHKQSNFEGVGFISCLCRQLFTHNFAVRHLHMQTWLSWQNFYRFF